MKHRLSILALLFSIPHEVVVQLYRQSAIRPEHDGRVYVFAAGPSLDILLKKIYSNL